MSWSFFFFGLALLAHGGAYFGWPVYVLLSTAYMVWHRRYTLRWLLVSVCILLAMAMPAGLSLLINGRHLPPVLTPFFSIPRLTGPPRYEAVSSVFDVNPFASVAMHARVLWQFLFTQTQSDGAIFNTVPGYGLLYLFSMPFVLLGAVLGIWRLRVRGFHTEALMLLLLLTALALGLVIDANVNRMNVLLLPVVFFLAEGLLYLCATRLQRCVVIMVYLASFLLFCKTYFTSYAAEVRWDFHDSFDRAIRLASARPGTVCITDSINMAYVYVLFWEKIDPRLFAKTVVYENPGGEFQSVRSFGRYIFGLSHCPLKRASALVLDSGGRLPVNKRDRHQWTLNQVDGFTVALRVVPARRRHGSK